MNKRTVIILIIISLVIAGSAGFLLTLHGNNARLAKRKHIEQYVIRKPGVPLNQSTRIVTVKDIGSANKTVINGYEGYMINVPSSWYVPERTNNILLISSGGEDTGDSFPGDYNVAQLRIAVLENPENLSPKEWINQQGGHTSELMEMKKNSLQ